VEPIRKKSKRQRSVRAQDTEPLVDPYRAFWLALTPAQRLRRSWRLRARLKDLQAIHDAKSLPQL
jgi:hypothetical protein